MSLLEELLAEVSDDVQTLSRDQVQKRIWELTKKTGRTRKVDPGAWKKKWCPSDQFILIDVPVSRLDQPIKPKFPKIVQKKVETQDPEPIFIDKNRFKSSTSSGMKRLRGVDTYVIDGKHRAEAAKKTKQKTIAAWVGTQAVPYLMDSKKKGQWWSDPGLKELQP